MPNKPKVRAHRLSLSPVSIAIATVVTLGVTYIALMAVVMSYAALTIGFAQSVRNDEATVAVLESRYLATVASITNTDYYAQGYEKPVAEVYVPGAPTTALR